MNSILASQTVDNWRWSQRQRAASILLPLIGLLFFCYPVFGFQKQASDLRLSRGVHVAEARPNRSIGNLYSVLEGAADRVSPSNMASVFAKEPRPATPRSVVQGFETEGTILGAPYQPLFEEASEDPWEVGGWISVGYHNRPVPRSVVRGDLGAFNDVPGNFNVNQLWTYLERKASPETSGLDWGMRMDLVYGTDAQKTQAFGGTGWDNNWDNGVYGWALPQLYGEVAGENWSLRLGHFFTLVGYEVIMTTENFFYSRSLAVFNVEPFTHSGALFTYSANENTDWYGGWVAGWDTGFEVNDGGSMFLGGFSSGLSDDATLTYITTIGDTGSRGGQTYLHSVVLNYQLTKNLEAVTQTDLLTIGETSEDHLTLHQYLFYDLNERWRWGNRVEWWKNQGVSFWEVTSGLNFIPNEKLRVRGELRYDRGPTNFDQTTFGLDAILTF